MLMSSRIIWSDNGVIKDLSVNQNSYVTGSDVIDYTTAQDYIYIGGDFPFNHRYFDVSSANAVSSTLTVDLWDGTQWLPAVDVIDQTSIAGASVAQSGVISWRPSETSSWVRFDTNNAGSTITGLSSLKIFGLYWARLSWSSSFTGTTAVKFIGQKFSDDNDMYVFYPEFSLTNVKAQFLAGKTNWNEQHLQSAVEIIRDLKKMQVALGRDQILDWEIFKEPSVHKTAAMIYQGFGKDFFENADRAEKKYKESLENNIKMIDKTNDAKLDVSEKISRDGWFSR